MCSSDLGDLDAGTFYAEAMMDTQPWDYWELDGKTPPPDCDKGGPNPAKTRAELLTYLRNSFAAMNNSLNAVNSKNMYEPIEGPYGGPNTRLGIAGLAIWHVADHYGQIVIYLRLNGIVPPASRATPPELKDYPAH